MEERASRGQSDPARRRAEGRHRACRKESEGSTDPSKLRALRRDRGLSQEHLAKKVGVPRTYALRWERDANRRDATSPTPAMLLAIAKALKVHPSELTTVQREDALLSHLREWAGLSQPELARRLGIATAAVSLFERGHQSLRDDLVAPLARALKIPQREVREAYERAAATARRERPRSP